MPFSVLLLTAASPERHITGRQQDRVIMQGSLLPGEVVLFFDKVDDPERPARKGLNIADGQKCCDGIIFYARGLRKVICLVEMKRNSLGDAALQIKSTYQHIYKMLKEECVLCNTSFESLTWLAWVYHTNSSQKEMDDCRKKLKDCNFADIQVVNDPDITNFLRGDFETEKRRSYHKGKR